MKTLIIYLSVTGNTDRLAKEIAEKLGNVDFLPIQLKTKIPKSKFWIGVKFGFLMTTRLGFRYNVSSIDLKGYDRVLIGSPVWMGKIAPPVIEVSKKLKIEDRIDGVFITHGGDPGSAFNHLSAILPSISNAKKMALANTENYDDFDTQDKIEDFVNNLEASILHSANS